MPKHELMMWLIAGGGTLAGSTLTLLAARHAPASARAPFRRVGRALTDGAGAVMAMSQAAIRKVVPSSKTDTFRNSAFEEYREHELARLESEQAAFSEYLQRLRDARDRQEFEDYLATRKSKPAITIDN